MKKKVIVTGIAAVALLVALQTSSVFAAAPVKETPSVNAAAPAEETPGVYTAALVEKAPSVYTAAPAEKKSSDNTNSDTVCNYCGKDCSFVDEDGDGICDNYKSRGTNGTNAGRNYVDKNSDGICDNYASGRHGACGWGGGHGHGYGGCHRR
ncbi:MAG: hypothetical protein HFG34_11310 [Eubacterium sp.]|nr:hypothetical protein [Eubacterium sp.]